MRFIKERRLLHFGFGGLEMGGDGSESAETQDKTPEAKEKENDNVEDPEQLIADELQKAEKEVDKSKKNVGKRLRDQADNFDKMAADAREKGDEQKASNLEADAALLRKSAASVEAAQNAGQKSLDDPKEGKTESDKDANPEKKTTTIDDAIDQLDDDAKLDPGKGPEETFNEIHKDKIAKKVGEQFCKTHNIPPENAKDVADVLKNPDAQKFFTELIDGLDAEDGPKTPEEVEKYIAEKIENLPPAVQEQLDKLAAVLDKKEDGEDGKEKPKKQTFAEAIKEFIKMFKEFFKGWRKELGIESTTEGTGDERADSSKDAYEGVVNKNKELPVSEVQKKLTDQKEQVNKNITAVEGEITGAKESSEKAGEKVKEAEKQQASLDPSEVEEWSKLEGQIKDLKKAQKLLMKI